MINTIKSLIRRVLFFPQVLVFLAGGGRLLSLSDYDRYTSFFRYFPFGRISKKGVATIKFKGKTVNMQCGGVHPLCLAETFGMEEYSKLDFMGKDVIDIGTAFGDTPVYFGLFGAKNVYGYEINKKYYKLCIENFKLNNLANCSVEFCGIGETAPSNFSGLGAIVPPEDRNEVASEMKSLKVIVKEKSIKNGVLKIDVDGYEYEIFDKADKETFSHFDEVSMEYHYGLRNLVEKLNEFGFKVGITPHKKVFIDRHPDGWKQMEGGMIFAKR